MYAIDSNLIICRIGSKPCVCPIDGWPSRIGIRRRGGAPTAGKFLMSIGLGIFLSALIFAMVGLYLTTRDRWDWFHISRWVAIGCGLLVGLGAIGLAATWGYQKIANLPTRQTTYADLTLGMTMDEVRYVRGDPEFVVKTYVTRGLTAEEFLNAVQVDDLKHDNDMKTYLTWGFPEKQQPWIVVSFDRRTKTLRNIWCFTGIDNIGNSNACPPLDGVRVGTSEEALVERLGEPSNQSIYGGDKTIDYNQYGLWFLLVRKRVIWMGIEG